MNTVFVGGSRRVSKLPRKVRERLDTVRQNCDRVIVGDANGVDKAVQKYLLETLYENVLIFCSGEKPRNNIGNWPVRHVEVPDDTTGFQFYATKDREMAREADFGLMIWDGKSAGTILNVLRLIAAGKKAVLHKVDIDLATIIKSKEQWQEFISECGDDLRDDLKKRATVEERALITEKGVDIEEKLTAGDTAKNGEPADRLASDPSASIDDFWKTSSLKSLADANSALAQCDAQAFMTLLGDLARQRGMTHISRESGLARESLYRSLNGNGNPEFITVLKVLDSIGIHLEAKFVDPKLQEATRFPPSLRDGERREALSHSKRR